MTPYTLVGLFKNNPVRDPALDTVERFLEFCRLADVGRTTSLSLVRNGAGLTEENIVIHRTAERLEGFPHATHKDWAFTVMRLRRRIGL